MRGTLFNQLKRGVIAAAILSAATLSARADDALVFNWPENPFGLTLSDELFVISDETRFERATRVFGEAVGGFDGIGQELFDIATYPLRDPLTFGTFALGVGALALIDKPTTSLYQQTVVPVGEHINIPKPFKIPHITTDEQIVGGALLGTYTYGIAMNDERAQVAALLSTKAIMYSYLTSHVLLKAGFGRLRPVSDLDGHTGPTGVFSTSPFDFFQSSGIHFDSNPHATGMPSFHFTMYFATARVYSGVYDNYMIPYGVAALLALNSAEGHNHWVSDMVAGALIGTGIGNVVLNNYSDRKRESFGMVMPIISSKGVGLSYSLNF